MKKKHCTVCDKLLSKDQFYKNWRAKDGLRSECKECTKKETKDYRRRMKMVLGSHAIKAIGKPPKKIKKLNPNKDFSKKAPEKTPTFEEFLDSIGAVNLAQLLGKKEAIRKGCISIQGSLTGNFRGFELIVAFDNGQLVITG